MKKKNIVKKITTIAVVGTFVVGGALLGYEEYYNHKYRGGERPSIKNYSKLVSETRLDYREKKKDEKIDISKYNIELYSTDKSYLGNPDTRNDVWIDTFDRIEDRIFKKSSGLDEEIQVKIKNRINYIKDNLDSMSNEEVYIEVLKINGYFNTNFFSLDVDLGSNKFYPIGVCWYEDELYIVDANEDYADLIGMRVEAINDVSINDVFSRINQFVSGKTEYDKKFNNVDALNFYILKWTGIIKEKDNFEARFKVSKDGNVEERILQLQDVSELMKPKFSVHYYDNIPKIEEKCQYETIWSKYDDQNEVFYIKFDKIIDSLSAAIYDPILKFNYLPREEISYELEENIKASNKINKVVIDFRECDPKALDLTKYFFETIYNTVNENIPKYIILDKNSDVTLLMELSKLKEKLDFSVVGEKPFYLFSNNEYCKQEYDLILNAGIFVGYPINGGNTKGEELEFDIIIHEDKNNYDKKIDTIYEYISNMN